MAKRRPPPKTSHTSSSKAAGASRRKTALQLHIEGHTFLVIGERLGVSRQRAHQLVREELDAASAERKELAGDALSVDLERIEFVLRSLAPKVERGDDKASQAYIRALDRRHKLLGLDAPTRNEHTGANGAPIAHQVAALEPTALHSRLAGVAARAARSADTAPARDPDGDGTG